jgi:hypothetical protein
MGVAIMSAGFKAHLILWRGIRRENTFAIEAALKTGTDCRPASLASLVTSATLATITEIHRRWLREVKPDPFAPKVKAARVGKQPKRDTDEPRGPKEPRVYTFELKPRQPRVRVPKPPKQNIKEMVRAALDVPKTPPGARFVATNKTGFPGVSKVPRENSFRAMISLGGRQRYVCQAPDAVTCARRLNAICLERGGEWLEHIVQIPEEQAA